MFAGFAKSYYLDRFFYNDPIPLFLHIHGFILTLWFVLFMIQVRLVATARINLHRRLGVAGAVVGGLVVLLGGIVAFLASRREFFAHPAGIRDLVGFKVPPIEGFAINSGFLINFALFLALAIYFRRQPEIHKRLMLLATCSILGPALMRIFLPYIDSMGLWSKFVLYDVVAFVFIALDTVFRRKLHPAFAWGGLFLLVSFPAIAAFAMSAVGIRGMAWLLTR